MKKQSFSLKREMYYDKAVGGQLVINDITVYTLEDPSREEKIYGETCIPAGEYELTLRNEGGMTLRYAKKFPDMHKGMIWLRDVPNFSYIYIHVGNYPKDTEGCILVGKARADTAVFRSVEAYKEIYPIIANVIENGGCTLEVI